MTPVFRSRGILLVQNISVISASVERIFSVAGQFFDDLRRKMGADVLEELMWAAINKGSRRKQGE